MMQRYHLTGVLSQVGADSSVMASDVYRAVDVDPRIEKLEGALQRIVQWADAYPLDVFPEPDFKKVNEVLKAAGLSLDRVYAARVQTWTAHLASALRERWSYREDEAQSKFASMSTP
ncbi:MAG: hypothetical protein ACT4O5_08685 [Gammaproteobacteria bacterium]